MRHIDLRTVFSVLLLLVSLPAITDSFISVSPNEDGSQRTGHTLIWHDETGKATIEDALKSYADGKFTSLQSAGSTGLNPGAFWSVIKLNNTSLQTLPLLLEYVDHQLIQLDAYELSADMSTYTYLTSLFMESPFSQRPIDHHRLVLPITLSANNQHLFLIRMNSAEVGYVFPSMRIWSQKQLFRATLIETGLVGFLFGGFFLMSTIAIVAAIASQQRIFYVYSIYAFAKITVWATILGFTHQYLITEHFQWRYLSMSGALAIFCGFLFARLFLETRKHTPIFDKLFLLSIANALVLFVGALMQWKEVAVITITIALLMYPVIVLAGFVRWRQGSLESGIFTLAWSFLVVGLVIQACRDLGLVAHNFINYYWPPVASFIELLAIMAALGVQMNRLRRQKKQAEYEAQTDHLTGVANRRSFFTQLNQRIKNSRNDKISLSLLIFDIDHFKQINDQYGHASGDIVLQRFCHAISTKLRENDVFGRLGGEEFGLIINEPLDAAIAIAQRLCRDIQKTDVTVKKQEIALTVSIGVAELSQQDSSELLFSRADKALYSAKSNGRNCVEAAFDKEF